MRAPFALKLFIVTALVMCMALSNSLIKEEGSTQTIISSKK